MGYEGDFHEDCFEDTHEGEVHEVDGPDGCDDALADADAMIRVIVASLRQCDGMTSQSVTLSWRRCQELAGILTALWKMGQEADELHCKQDRLIDFQREVIRRLKVELGRKSAYLRAGSSVN